MSEIELWERVVDAERRAATAEAKVAMYEARERERLDKQRARKDRFLTKRNVPERSRTSKNVPKRSRTSESVPSPSPSPSPSSPTPLLTTSSPPTPDQLLASDDAGGVPDVPGVTPSDQPAVDEDPIPTTSTSWVAEFGDVYKAVHGGLPNYGKLGKHLKPAVDAFGRERALAAWRRFCASSDVRFGPAHFVEHFGTYEPQLIGARGDEAAILAWMAEDRS